MEVQVPNPSLDLKPGMFVRVTVVLEKLADTLMVPETALVTRHSETGIFVVTPDHEKVTWHPVVTGIRQNHQVQIQGAQVSGLVVTLGHQLLDHGSRIRIVHQDR